MKKITIVSELLDFKPRIWRRFEISDQNTVQDLMDATMVLFQMTHSHMYHLELATEVNKFTRANRDERGKLTKNIPPKLFLQSETIRPDMTNSKLNFACLDYGDFTKDFYDGYGIDDESNIYDIRNYKMEEDGSVSYTPPKKKKKKKRSPHDKLESLKLVEGDRMYFYYDYGDDWQIKLLVEKSEDIDKSDLKLIPKILRGKGFGIVEDIGGTYGLKEEFDEFPELKEFDKLGMQEDLTDIFNGDFF